MKRYRVVSMGLLCLFVLAVVQCKKEEAVSGTQATSSTPATAAAKGGPSSPPDLRIKLKVKKGSDKVTVDVDPQPVFYGQKLIWTAESTDTDDPGTVSNVRVHFIDPKDTNAQNPDKKAKNDKHIDDPDCSQDCSIVVPSTLTNGGGYTYQATVHHKNKKEDKDKKSDPEIVISGACPPCDNQVWRTMSSTTTKMETVTITLKVKKNDKKVYADPDKPAVYWGQKIVWQAAPGVGTAAIKAVHFLGPSDQDPDPHKKVKNDQEVTDPSCPADCSMVIPSRLTEKKSYKYKATVHHKNDAEDEDKFSDPEIVISGACCFKPGDVRRHK